MHGKSKLVFLVIVGLLSLMAGYTLVVGELPGSTPAIARSSEMPENPHILYLANEGIQRGEVDDVLMEARGATPVRNWQAVLAAAKRRPVDALIVDADFFEAMTDADRQWLYTQMREGIVIVGLGTELDSMAQYLGLDTLRNPNEGARLIGPTGYVMFESQIIGQPSDVQKMEDSNWLNRMLAGNSEGVLDIKSPLARSVGQSRGNLISDQDIEVFFLRLTSKIEGLYRTRADYQKAIKEFQQ